ncbi:MAG: ABC transporter substrate-binding protein [Spirochaetes bacterium]|nr:ABC transporter substrate-binding protein [Spirochaetota bacterium]
MKKGKKLFFILIVIALISSLLTSWFFKKKKKKDDMSGKEVVILGAIASDDEIGNLEACFEPFEKRTGITIKYEGTKEFENLIFVRAEAGNPPDVAMFPQPGGVIKLARQGKLVPMKQKTIDNVKKNYSQGWIDLMTVDGTIYGVVHRVNIKSNVFYPKKAWEAKGWPIPKTWDELKKLCDDMVAQGETPWAIGIESGVATGWPATDWMEDIMLRTAGPKVYDQWVNHEIPFNHPAVKKAAEVMSDMWFTEGYVYGGRKLIPTTNFGDAILPLFENPPKAWMHRQGNFILNFLPEDIQANFDEEVGVFALPGIDPKWGTPVLGGGDVYVAFKDRPEVHEMLYYFSTGESGEAWAKAGGALFAYRDQDINAYQSDLDKTLAKVLINAKVFRFDGSDLMASEVGAGSFWKEMTNYVTGNKDLDTALKDIESTWP